MVVHNNMTFRKYNINDDNIVVNNNYIFGRTLRVFVGCDGVRYTKSYKIIGVDLID